MTLSKLFPVVSVSMLVLAACGSDDATKKPSSNNNNAGSDPAKSGGTAALSADERACEDFYKVQAGWTGRCGGILNTSDQTIARFRRVCARELAAPGAEGLRDARAKCAEKLKTAACDQEISECDLPGGTLADGQACAGRTQCKSRYCKLDDSGCGVCSPLVKAGGECTSPSDCAYGKDEVTSCDAKSQTATTGTCSVWKVAKAGQTCNAEAFCDARSHCDVKDENAKSGTCLANLDVGKTCDDTRACRPGLVCLDKKCSAKPKEGEKCNGVDDCVEGLGCDGTCKPVVYVGAREVCNTVKRCARGRCVQPVTQGSNGQTTPSGDATCIDPLQDGEACGNEQATKGLVCDVFARCLGGKCVLEDPSVCK